MRRSFLALPFVLAFTIALSGCSFSKQSRQQRAYEKYVRKSSAGRLKQQKRMRPKKSDMPSQPMPSDPIESSETSEVAPQKMPKEEGQP